MYFISNRIQWLGSEPFGYAKGEGKEPVRLGYYGCHRKCSRDRHQGVAPALLLSATWSHFSSFGMEAVEVPGNQRILESWVYQILSRPLCLKLHPGRLSFSHCSSHCRPKQPRFHRDRFYISFIWKGFILPLRRLRLKERQSWVWNTHAITLAWWLHKKTGFLLGPW